MSGYFFALTGQRMSLTLNDNGPMSLGLKLSINDIGNKRMKEGGRLYKLINLLCILHFQKLT
jgi:hypothetical protein